MVAWRWVFKEEKLGLRFAWDRRGQPDDAGPVLLADEKQRVPPGSILKKINDVVVAAYEANNSFQDNLVKKKEDVKNEERVIELLRRASRPVVLTFACTEPPPREVWERRDFCPIELGQPEDEQQKVLLSGEEGVRPSLSLDLAATADAAAAAGHGTPGGRKRSTSGASSLVLIAEAAEAARAEVSPREETAVPAEALDALRTTGASGIEVGSRIRASAGNDVVLDENNKSQLLLKGRVIGLAEASKEVGFRMFEVRYNQPGTDKQFTRISSERFLVLDDDDEVVNEPKKKKRARSPVEQRKQEKRGDQQNEKRDAEQGVISALTALKKSGPPPTTLLALRNQREQLATEGKARRVECSIADARVVNALRGPPYLDASSGLNVLTHCLRCGSFVKPHYLDDTNFCIVDFVVLPDGATGVCDCKDMVFARNELPCGWQPAVEAASYKKLMTALSSSGEAEVPQDLIDAVGVTHSLFNKPSSDFTSVLLAAAGMAMRSMGEDELYQQQPVLPPVAASRRGDFECDETEARVVNAPSEDRYIHAESGLNVLTHCLECGSMVRPLCDEKTRARFCVLDFSQLKDGHRGYCYCQGRKDQGKISRRRRMVFRRRLVQRAGRFGESVLSEGWEPAHGANAAYRKLKLPGLSGGGREKHVVPVKRRKVTSAPAVMMEEEEEEEEEEQQQYYYLPEEDEDDDEDDDDDFEEERRQRERDNEQNARLEILRLAVASSEAGASETKKKRRRKKKEQVLMADDLPSNNDEDAMIAAAAAVLASTSSGGSASSGDARRTRSSTGVVITSTAAAMEGKKSQSQRRQRRPTAAGLAVKSSSQVKGRPMVEGVECNESEARVVGAPEDSVYVHAQSGLNVLTHCLECGSFVRPLCDEKARARFCILEFAALKDGHKGYCDCEGREDHGKVSRRRRMVFRGVGSLGWEPAHGANAAYRLLKEAIFCPAVRSRPSTAKALYKATTPKSAFGGITQCMTPLNITHGLFPPPASRLVVAEAEKAAASAAAAADPYHATHGDNFRYYLNNGDNEAMENFQELGPKAAALAIKKKAKQVMMRPREEEQPVVVMNNPSSSSSSYRGVYSRGRQWVAHLVGPASPDDAEPEQLQRYYLGTYDSERGAALAHDAKARELGLDVRCNFQPEAETMAGLAQAAAQEQWQPAQDQWQPALVLQQHTVVTEPVVGPPPLVVTSPRPNPLQEVVNEAERQLSGFVRAVATLFAACDRDLVAWSLDGKRLFVNDCRRFAEQVCPRFFRHRTGTKCTGACVRRLLETLNFSHTPAANSGQGLTFELVTNRKRNYRPTPKSEPLLLEAECDLEARTRTVMLLAGDRLGDRPRADGSDPFESLEEARARLTLVAQRIDPNRETAFDQLPPNDREAFIELWSHLVMRGWRIDHADTALHYSDTLGGSSTSVRRLFERAIEIGDIPLQRRAEEAPVCESRDGGPHMMDAAIGQPPFPPSYRDPPAPLPPTPSESNGAQPATIITA